MEDKKRQVFFSFYYADDVLRVSQIRNISVLKGNPSFSDNEQEEVKRKGNNAIRYWIDENMKCRSCVIVLIGENTASRKWVKYEIEKAWRDGKGLFGIYIHNFKDPKNGKPKKGRNPFDEITYGNRKLSGMVEVYDPDSSDACNDVANNISRWIEKAIADRNN